MGHRSFSSAPPSTTTGRNLHEGPPRNVLPDLLSNTLEVVKLTSLASVVALPELLFEARQAQSVTFNPTPIVAAAVLYFVVLWPLVRLLSRLENRAIAGRG